ncbi:MAG: hypothetical protein JXR84_09310 [Anaerolineae bacterium]|nr:hypothetical protein [Anaerolineae bacterium]
MTIDAAAPTVPLSRPLRVLRRALPVLMLLMLTIGLAGGARLVLALGHPFSGVALMWRKELKLLVVSWVTPPHWPGLDPGQLQVNDRVLCIEGYHPSPESPVYGLDPRYVDEPCPRGGKTYLTIFRERFDAGSPATVTFRVDRDKEIITVPDVPLSVFNWVSLAEIFLPNFLLGLGLLIVGLVVYRANPTAEINLIFTSFATISAGLVLQEACNARFSTHLVDMRFTALVGSVPWTPLLGAVLFHLTGLFTDRPPLLVLTRWIRRPYYVLSSLFSLLGIFVYTMNDHPVAILFDWTFSRFVAVSILFSVFWSMITLLWTWRATPSRRLQRQTSLILAGMVIMTPLLLVYGATLFLNATYRYVNYAPYLGLGVLGMVAYTILRYQLFTAKARILTALLIAIGCILMANLVYLLLGQITGFLPILATALITGLALEVQQGPTAFFNRLLRREMLHYQIVARFGQHVGGLQQSAALVSAARRAFQEDLEVEYVNIWLLNSEQQTLERFLDGDVIDATPISQDFATHLSARPTPVYAATPEAASYRALFQDDAAQPVAVWAPLVEREQTVGLLGLGPRWTGEVYEEQDLELIGILARQMALSILNTRQWERIQQMSYALAQAEENERRKIARELHDTVLQFLLVLTYGLDDLKEQCVASAGGIEQWQDRISAEAAQLRDLLSYLRAPEMLVQRGLAASLETWMEQARQDTTMRIQTDLSPTVEEALSVEAKVAIYRVFRETIRNALKHSQGSCVAVQWRREGDWVRFSIRDDGTGFDIVQALQAGGRGYSSLQDVKIYVENVGGWCDIRSMPGEGTVVSGTVPARDRPIVDA